MYESTTIIASRGHQQHAAFDRLVNDLLEVRFRLCGDGLLAGADVDDGDTSLQSETDRAREVQLGNGAQVSFIGLAKEQRQHETGTPWRQSRNGIPASKDKAANAGPVCVGVSRTRRDHRLQNVDRGSLKDRMAQVRNAVDNPKCHRRRSRPARSERGPNGSQRVIWLYNHI
jgi:hypothetical protein